MDAARSRCSNLWRCSRNNYHQRQYCLRKQLLADAASHHWQYGQHNRKPNWKHHHAAISVSHSDGGLHNKYSWKECHQHYRNVKCKLCWYNLSRGISVCCLCERVKRCENLHLHRWNNKGCSCWRWQRCLYQQCNRNKFLLYKRF